MTQEQIEQKAKAYDEALERARQLNVDNMLSDESLEEIFPELKESEGERTKREIIEYLNSQIPTAEETELLCFKRWIAWLEKQGDQEPADKENISLDEEIINYIDKHFHIRNDETKER